MGSVKIDVKIKEDEESFIVTGDCEVKNLTSRAIGIFFADTLISIQKDGGYDGGGILSMLFGVRKRFKVSR